MKLLINVAILACQLSSIVGRPELIQLNELDELPDIPDFRRSRDKTQYSKVPTYNAIPNENRPLYSSKQPNEDKTQQKTSPDFNPIQITQDDVVTGSNSVYGSQSLSNSGVIYAISQGQRSTSEPLVPAAPPQPVLMQFLSAEGTPKQASVQYIQLLKPLMMVPAQPYQQPKPFNEIIIPNTTPTTQMPTQPQQTPRNIPTYPTLSPFGALSRQPFSGQFTSQTPSYQPHGFRTQQMIMKQQQQASFKHHQSPFQPQMNQQSQHPQAQALSQPESDYDSSQLNINEYMPGTIPIPLSPRSSVSPMRSQYVQMSMQGNYNQYPMGPPYQPMAQRA